VLHFIFKCVTFQILLKYWHKDQQLLLGYSHVKSSWKRAYCLISTYWFCW